MASENFAEHAFLTLLKGHPLLVNHLDAALRKDAELSLIEYGMLVTLSEAPERRLTMAELARAVVYSRSGLTTLVDSLERRGLIVRERSQTDRRSWYTTLTDDGLTARRAAEPVYTGFLHDHVLAHLTPERAEAIAAVYGAVIADLAPDWPELRQYHPSEQPTAIPHES
ncbi:MarR family transcriptional regulator [Actinoplanes sp. NPDC026670]|uniref:MarR family winged helix-turn-helix transcriptional regulator n=1 Tax=Actinoplanes sp. NPDC026670 TaxID=3154700 RepID=UPI0033FF7E25